jgi:hypothetical protein
MPNPSTIAQEETWSEPDVFATDSLPETPETPAYREYRIILGLSKPYAGHSPQTLEISETELLGFCNSRVAQIRDALTVVIGYGYWKGKREGSATVSWIDSDHTSSMGDAYEIARAWNKRHNQECSIVSWSPVEHFDFVS